MPHLCLLDSCFLYPRILCDTLLRVAEHGLYRVYFSQEILDGATRNLIKNGKFDIAQASRFQSFVIQAFPEGLVEVPDGLAAIMTNDPGDRHVLAAAVACKAEVIVTFNLKDFSPESLASWNVEAQHPDAFLSELCDLYGVEQLAQIVQKQAEDRNRPQTSVLDLLTQLGKQVPSFVCEVTTKLYGEEVEAIARKCIATHRSHSFSGKVYDLCLTNGSLIIAAKDGRGEILRSQAGNVQGILAPDDVRRFQEVDEDVDAKFSAVVPQ